MSPAAGKQSWGAASRWALQHRMMVDPRTTPAYPFAEAAQSATIAIRINKWPLLYTTLGTCI
jgi:hypothetical protein